MRAHESELSQSLLAKNGDIDIQLTCKVFKHSFARLCIRLKQTPELIFGPVILPRYFGERLALGIAQMAGSNYERFFGQLAHFTRSTVCAGRSALGLARDDISTLTRRYLW